MGTKIFIIVSITMWVITVTTWAGEINFPTKPIRMWVGFPPGSSTDIMARAIAIKTEKFLGQPIVVENKPGGAGAVAMGLLKNEKLDGYTLGYSTDSPFTRIPHTTKVAYAPFKDFDYIILTQKSKAGVVVKSESPFKRFKDVIEFAMQNPGKLTHGAPGFGTTPHLAMEYIAKTEKVTIQHVFFSGTVPTVTAVLGGHVMIGSCTTHGYFGHVKAGTMRPLMTFERERDEEWPEVPTSKDLGYGFEVPLCELIVAPRGVPKPIMGKLITAFSEGMKSQEVQNLGKTLVSIVSQKPLSGDELQTFVENRYNFYGPLIRELELKKK
jgi:tripartite-type tricarboxylate transporter receptor subunit TctC